jgi:hypothetical protein
MGRDGVGEADTRRPSPPPAEPAEGAAATAALDVPTIGGTVTAPGVDGGAVVPPRSTGCGVYRSTDVPSYRGRVKEGSAPGLRWEPFAKGP